MYHSDTHTCTQTHTHARTACSMRVRSVLNANFIGLLESSPNGTSDRNLLIINEIKITHSFIPVPVWSLKSLSSKEPDKKGLEGNWNPTGSESQYVNVFPVYGTMAQPRAQYVELMFLMHTLLSWTYTHPMTLSSLLWQRNTATHTLWNTAMHTLWNTVKYSHAYTVEYSEIQPYIQPRDMK